MAKRNSRNNNKLTKFKKIEPSVKKFLFQPDMATGLADATFMIDTSQVASLLNRRFYRQGLQWAVAGIKVVVQQAQASSQPLDAKGLRVQYKVSKLPETWVMSNAWHKSFAAWEDMNDAALEDAESVKPRFLDFKIYADADHHAAGFVGNLLPVNGAAFAIPGEWESSKLHVPESGVAGATHTRELIATGPNYPGASPITTFNAVSLIEGYASSRGLPDIRDPNAPDDAADADGLFPANWMTALSNEGLTQDSEVLEDMITENNIAPYPFENDGVNLDTMYPGGANQLPGLEIHDISLQTGTSLGATTRIPGGLFPCGLIRIDVSNQSQTAEDPVRIPSLIFALELTMVPGNHRGYLAEPMQDM